MCSFKSHGSLPEMAFSRFLPLTHVFWCFSLPSYVNSRGALSTTEEFSAGKSNGLQHAVGKFGFVATEKLYLVSIFRAS